MKKGQLNSHMILELIKIAVIIYIAYIILKALGAVS